MKNFIKIILLMSISLLLLIGCSSKEQEKTIDNFINKLLSVKTYEGITFGEDLDKYAEESKANFGEYFTENGFDTLMANTILHFYYTVINENNVKDITDIKIVKTKESENDTYKNYEFIHYEYEVSYKLKLDDKSIDMTDYMVFKVMKDNTSIIDEVSIFKEKSSIFIEYLNSKNYQIN
ncbi:MAG: hypothetical protein E6300_08580 [Clostridium sp.]|uniref:hypothetical protein n=1 Tax=Clostridium sp. TaxID=1506 RepID=UPI001EC7AEB1|nr:hypothetical protein [Clostridium sp.]MBS5885038.1 hypothetical protein [Clostridium sp.]MDU7148534.1 hypothetical protein [Clostridium sp.]MDU7241823.1 hypothetical protein [Clostridium sp.]